MSGAILNCHIDDRPRLKRKVESDELKPRDKTFILAKISFHALAILYQEEEERYLEAVKNIVEEKPDA